MKDTVTCSQTLCMLALSSLNCLTVADFRDIIFLFYLPTKMDIREISLLSLKCIKTKTAKSETDFLKKNTDVDVVL